jgi:hypothetical protein
LAGFAPFCVVSAPKFICAPFSFGCASIFMISAPILAGSAPFSVVSAPFISRATQKSQKRSSMPHSRLFQNVLLKSSTPKCTT